MPFFPPRPTTGARITCPADISIIDQSKYLCQGKLNGDSSCILVLDGKTYAQNRHGSWFKHPIDGLSNFLKLPNRTLLAGEVWQKNFYPFEAVVLGGKSLVFTGPEVREAAAIQCCELMGISFIFHPQDAMPTPKWEGFVLKRRGSPYIPLGSDSQLSKDWVKRKWLN
jgi:hypothetical protein